MNLLDFVLLSKEGRSGGSRDGLTDKIGARRFGQLRQGQIIETLRLARGLSSYQLAELFFKNVKPELRQIKARAVLRKLYQDKKINRYRRDINTPYIYYLGRYNNRVTDWPKINEVLMSIFNQLASWQRILELKTEVTISLDGRKEFLVPDAWLQMKVTMDRLRCLFLEYEDSQDFYKTTKYEKLYTTFKYEPWAVELADEYEFPYILVVCETATVKKYIQKKVARDNKYNLPYRVATADEVKTDIWSVLKGGK